MTYEEERLLYFGASAMAETAASRCTWDARVRQWALLLAAASTVAACKVAEAQQ